MSGLFYRARFRSDHRWTPDRMSAYLDGELASSGWVRIERHVGECDECRRLLAGLRRMLDVLGRPRAPAGEFDPFQIAASVRARLAEPPES